MHIEQIYTGCLAQGAYYIHDGGEAVIIDPLREVSPYIDRAERDGVKIKYIFETHFHADFVSGHLTLAERTGAPIVYGPLADPKFDAYIAKDEEEFRVGNLTFRVLHTPGHTMESTTYLLLDADRKQVAIFTGDTLFLGDVGRPDLAQKAANMTQEELAATLYDSLRNKIMPLDDEVLVYPAHGAGSACGKNMMSETVDTLGNQKKVNYALRQDMTKEEFVEEVTEGLTSPPQYFPLNVKLNKEGYQDIDAVLASGMRALTPEKFEALANAGDVLMLDVRSPEEYAQAHVPNSIFIGIDGSFAPWVGELVVDVKQAILLITPEGREEEVVTRLSRVGFDNTLGYLHGGIAAWMSSGREVDGVDTIEAHELVQIYHKDSSSIFDVRKEGEYDSEHLDKVSSMPLNQINSLWKEFPSDKTFYVHCAGGYRSMIASSILKARGVHNVVNVNGGFKAIRETELPVVAVACTKSN